MNFHLVAIPKVQILGWQFQMTRGSYYGAEEKEGIRCVHPVQAYLDLKDQPERAEEAAERLRKEYLSWRTNG